MYLFGVVLDLEVDNSCLPSLSMVVVVGLFWYSELFTKASRCGWW